MASFSYSYGRLVFAIILCAALTDTLELKPNKENETRISVIRKYRIQRRLSAPEIQFPFDDSRESSDEKIRKPKRKTIYRLNHKKPTLASKASLLSSHLSNKPWFKKTVGKDSDYYESPTKATMGPTLTSNRLGLSSLELNEIRTNRKGHWGLPYPTKEDIDEDEDIGSDSRPIRYAIDPAHPALAAVSHNPLAPFNPIAHQPGLPPAPASQKKKRKSELANKLLPLDKTHLTLGLAFGWIFWLGAFMAYYFWGEDKYGKLNLELFGDLSHQHQMDSKLQAYPQKPIIVKIEPGLPPQFYQSARSLGGSSSFNFARVLDMISIAQETYEKFDFQSLDCQKKALCELQQKQTEFGETGRKITNTFSFMDALEGLPMPAIIQTYLKEYKEALLQGKNSTKECASIYPKCGFSIKEVFVKYSKKAKLN